MNSLDSTDSMDSMTYNFLMIKSIIQKFEWLNYSLVCPHDFDVAFFFFEWAGMSFRMAFTRQFHPSSVKVNVFIRANWCTLFCLIYQSDNNVHAIDQNWVRLAEELVNYTFVQINPSGNKSNLAIAICSSWIRIHYWRDLNDPKQIGTTLFAKSSEVSLSHFRILCHRIMALLSSFEYDPSNYYGSFDHSTSILL
jgi:hypothetical protein